MIASSARLGFAAMLAAAASSAAAQNGYSFLDAEKSAVNYGHADVRAQLACRALAGMTGDGITIVSASMLAASGRLPAFCRVVGVIAPQVQFEVALPENWNRRIYMRGNGGFAGENLLAPARAFLRNEALRHGFVAVQTDTGHEAATDVPLGSFAAQLDKKVDYAFRAVHVTINAAKRIAHRYYDRPAAYSYWDGCSTGGRQALIAAQRFPGDFDGIIAGAPVLNFVDTVVSYVSSNRALAESPIPIAKMSLVADAVYKKCDAKDGLADGIIDDPRRCDFDPVKDLPRCTGNTEQTDCFTNGQIAALQSIYRGAQGEGKALFFGQPVGAEKAGVTPLLNNAVVTGWADWYIGMNNQPSRHLAYMQAFLRYIAFGAPQPNYDWKTFDLNRDPPRLEAARRLINATDPDLSEFKNRGGKVIMYFGWADTALNPLMGVDYFEKVRAKFGPATADFFRLYMMPGMFHCRGGVGPDRLDALTPLIDWVETGKRPDALVASEALDGKVKRSRPLCPYPQVARHKGTGSVDDAANFECRNLQ